MSWAMLSAGPEDCLMGGGWRVTWKKHMGEHKPFLEVHLFFFFGNSLFGDSLKIFLISLLHYFKTNWDVYC